MTGPNKPPCSSDVSTPTDEVTGRWADDGPGSRPPSQSQPDALSHGAAMDRDAIVQYALAELEHAIQAP
jgi:hypothetical protein